MSKPIYLIAVIFLFVYQNIFAIAGDVMALNRESREDKQQEYFDERWPICSRYDYSPLLLAIHDYETTDQIKDIICQVSPNFENIIDKPSSRGYTPLMVAINNNRIDAVRLLLDCGANLIYPATHSIEGKLDETKLKIFELIKEEAPMRQSFLKERKKLLTLELNKYLVRSLSEVVMSYLVLDSYKDYVSNEYLPKLITKHKKDKLKKEREEKANSTKCVIS